MDEILVSREDFWQRRRDLSEMLPMGTRVGTEARLARNYGSGQILVLYGDEIFLQAQNILRSAGLDKPKSTWADLEEALVVNEFADGDIGLYFYILKLMTRGDIDVASDSEAVLTTFPLDSEKVPVPVLELRLLRRSGRHEVFARLPLLWIDEASANSGNGRGFWGVSNLIESQHFVLLNCEGGGRWKIRARIEH